MLNTQEALEKYLFWEPQGHAVEQWDLFVPRLFVPLSSTRFQKLPLCGPPHFSANISYKFCPPLMTHLPGLPESWNLILFILASFPHHVFGTGLVVGAHYLCVNSRTNNLVWCSSQKGTSPVTLGMTGKCLFLLNPNSC